MLPTWALVIAAIFVALYAFDKFRASQRLSPAKRAVFVTGCDTGFGNIAVKDLDKLNIRVFAGCLTEEGVKLLSQECSKRVTPLLVDVTKQQSIDKAAEDVKAACEKEGLQLWGVVNNAGVYVGFYFDLCSTDFHRRCIEVNYLGTVNVCKAFLDPLKQSQGRIVNVASMAGFSAQSGTSAYSASKFALEGFSDALRREMNAWGVRVCLVEPGLMKTPLTTHAYANNINGITSKLTPEKKAEYGPAFFERIEKLNKILADGWASADPQLVVDAIVDALLTVSPRTRYRMPFSCSVVYWLSLLPPLLSDTILSLADLPNPVATQRRK